MSSDPDVVAEAQSGAVPTAEGKTLTSPDFLTHCFFAAVVNLKHNRNTTFRKKGTKDCFIPSASILVRFFSVVL